MWNYRHFIDFNRKIIFRILNHLRKKYYSSVADRALIIILQNGATRSRDRKKRHKALWERTVGVWRSEYDRFKRFHVSNRFLCVNIKKWVLFLFIFESCKQISCKIIIQIFLKEIIKKMPQERKRCNEIRDYTCYF